MFHFIRPDESGYENKATAFSLIFFSWSSSLKVRNVIINFLMSDFHFLFLSVIFLFEVHFVEMNLKKNATTLSI
jgi:hypothetical protein